MIYSQNYIMCDQVKQLVPSLMKKQQPLTRIEKIRGWIQIGAFFLATSCYIGALSLTAQ